MYSYYLNYIGYVWSSDHHEGDFISMGMLTSIRFDLCTEHAVNQWIEGNLGLLTLWLCQNNY